MSPRSRRPIVTWLKRIWITAGILAMLYMAWTFQAHRVEMETYHQLPAITMSDSDEMISFISDTTSTLPQVLFYPGGLVAPKAYVPLAAQLATEGYDVHIIKMPFRMANQGHELILELFDLHDPTRTYYLGGHSQGAKMAAQFVYEHPEAIDGLFLLGTSHPRDIDMSHLIIPTLKVYAEHDGLASVPEVMANKHKMPSGSLFKEIKGANHSQFGYFGTMIMDESAEISREVQHQQTVDILAHFLAGIEAQN